MKKSLILVLVIALVSVLAFTACAPAPAASSSAAPASSEAASAAPSSSAAAASSAPAAADNSKLNVQVLAKGFQHQFWQVVKKGAEAAAKDLGVGTMDFNGPEGESAIDTQVQMLNAMLAKNPSAIALAALDTESVKSQLNDAMSKKIPIIGFDSGVPDAPAGAIAATASTNNEAAAAIAADEMFKDAAFLAKLKAATADNPVVVAVLSQDATSASVTGRTQGFVDEMKKNAETLFAGGVSVEGHDKYKAASTSPAVVKILVQVPPTPNADDMKNGAQAVLGTKNLVGIFLSNEGAVTGLLNATNDGADLDRTKGKFKDITVAGFDAGKTQKAAVKSGAFLGSVTQDPFQIGYKAVALAVDAANGKTVADVDTGAKWYNKDNMDQADIAQLLYD